MRFPGKNAVLVAALLAAVSFAGWLGFMRYLASASSFTDGVHIYDTRDSGAVRYAVWESPERLPGAINTNASESRPALSPDGRWMVFAVGERGLNSELYIAEMVDNRPVDPKPLAHLNTEADECAPAFAADALYFASDRKGGAGGLDIYRAPFASNANGEFGAPERLGDEINSDVDDTDPAPRPSGRELVFASNRHRAGFELYVARPGVDGAGPSVRALDVLNSPYDERDPAFTADGRTLFFASNRKSGTDDFDLYRSSQRGEVWSAPVALDGLNTTECERAPLPAFDDFSLYFARSERAESGHADSDLWRARSVELYRIPDRKISATDVAILGALLLLALLVVMAKRWPKLELIYKCYLVSILAHLGVLWLSGGWYLPGVARGRPWDTGTTDAGQAGETEHFALDLRSSIAARGAGGSRGADGRAERSGSGLETALAKGFSAALDGGEEGASPVVVAAPVRGEIAMPSRASGGGSFDPSPSPGTSGGVALDDHTGIERRSGAAPGMHLDAGATSAAYSAVAVGAPARPAGVGSKDAPDLPRGGAVIDAPVAAAESAPTRGGNSISPGEIAASSVPVSIAAPREELGRMSGGASGLALDALADSSADATRVGRARPDGPERRARGNAAGEGSSRSASDAANRAAGDADHDAAGDVLGSSSASAIAALAPTAPLGIGGTGTGGTGSGGTGRAAFDGEPSPTPGASIGLRDAESSGTKISGAAGPGGGGKSGDLLDSLEAPRGLPGGAPGGSPDGVAGGIAGGKAGGATTDILGGSRGRALDAALEKPSFARDSTEAAPAPRALALELSDDRPRDEPPRPAKAWENTPYKNRAGDDKARALTLNGGTRETEAAVAKGLAYLAKIQRSSGGWGNYEERDDKYGQFAVGKTGLALLAFLGAGHTHLSHTEYSDNVMRAIAFLIALQDRDSGHFGDSEAYSHGIATYALAECYALTGESELRAPLERAVAHILSKQNHARDPRLSGGWSYYYRDDRVYDRWPRTSITVWQVMALESARLAGLTVPEQAFEDAAAFIRNAEDEEHGWFRYNHDPSRLSSSWPTLPASTPAALFALSLVGQDINAQELSSARDFVLSRTPSEYKRGSENEFIQRGQGNLYFWYYGTLSMFRAGGNAWQRWNTGMKEALVRGQKKDGSWAPIDLYCNYARDDEHDRSYSTSMCVLSLEVYYRYYLPLLKVR